MDRTGRWMAMRSKLVGVGIILTLAPWTLAGCASSEQSFRADLSEVGASGATIDCFIGAFDSIEVEPSLANLDRYGDSPVMGPCAGMLVDDSFRGTGAGNN